MKGDGLEYGLGKTWNALAIAPEALMFEYDPANSAQAHGRLPKADKKATQAFEVGDKVVAIGETYLEGRRGRVVALTPRPSGMKYRVLLFERGSRFVFFPWELGV